MDTVFITGVSRGFGLALSQALVSENTQLIGFGRTQGEFSGHFHKCDLADQETVGLVLKTAFLEAELAKSHRIIFINNAGTLGPLKRVEDILPAEIHRNITANVTATAIALSSFLSATKKLDCEKLFINISSGAALPERPKASWSLYCASKAGQDQLIRTVAKEQETQTYPTTLINFNPGVMETRMQEEIRATPQETFPDVGRFIKLREDGKVASPEEVAKNLVGAFVRRLAFSNGLTYAPGDLV
ncbi:SDR family NAD(P)-dependent oxidoreductase [Puniceicoccaceae bacterium K14]|nr:SDR family NAD(P)-dependent oxidoreductase [Puniceicoccaceae bacterium K14]